ncbi:dihydroorotate dehydrogenase (NAD+) catalytic subunit [Methanohalophilus levihalophilus]|uniref:dihydroorotate dehydrogenase n=1 Tax=Methanohalophilus levihalophilus TaxID=1431282 RepID=UPI001AE5BFBF|nr:dihydroorotate dehydrogenase [Methanohalophilus levihalophilus]MBP2031057.1 dihydroorotate dehydrogenase (NAD+) catalytic subunit [Methanohalophilus levihalophilus]
MEIAGVNLKNPVILASGIMGTTGASLNRIAQSGAGGVVTKSIGPVAKEGHKNPSMVKLDCGYLNAMGLPNPSYTEFSEELSIAVENSGVPVIASIFGGNAEEFVEVAEGLMGELPAAFELNVSCPHAEGYGASIGVDSCLVGEITAAVCDVVDVPVWVKLTPNVTDIVSVGKAAVDSGAAAIVAINTVRGMAIDIYSGYPVLGNRFGGLSGDAIRPVAVKCVYDLYAALDVPIIGVGGVSNWKNAVEMMMAGASAVEVGSAVYNSVEVLGNIACGIDTFLDEASYSSVEEIVGLAHRRI